MLFSFKYHIYVLDLCRLDLTSDNWTDWYGALLISDNAFLTRSNPCKYYGEEGKYGAIGATSRGKSNPQLLLD